jgi:ABC-type sulfate/molybdate transport systems ATPase subunit
MHVAVNRVRAEPTQLSPVSMICFVLSTSVELDQCVALAARPRVLLLDEPFNALDAPIPNALRREVARLRRHLGLLALFVTHDLQEAYALADRIAVYDTGAVLQSGPRAEVFRWPASVRVAELLEARNIFEGRVVQKNEAFTEVETPWFRARARAEGGLAPVRLRRVRCGRSTSSYSVPTDRTRTRSRPPLDALLIDEEATGTNHRLYLRVTGKDGPKDCIIEADLSAHPYEVMGVATRRDWRVAFTLDQTVAIPVQTT